MNDRYDVELTRQAEKDLLSMVPHVKAITMEILVLETKPYAGHDLKGNLYSFRSLEFSLKGTGECRAAYVVIESKKTCLVFAIGTHEGFYKTISMRAKAIRNILKNN